MQHWQLPGGAAALGEGVKSPASAMNTGSFRHGPQEMVAAGARFGIWIDAERMRGQDLAVARDLRKLGAAVMLIGQDIPQDAVTLCFSCRACCPAGNSCRHYSRAARSGKAGAAFWSG